MTFGVLFIIFASLVFIAWLSIKDCPCVGCCEKEAKCKSCKHYYDNRIKKISHYEPIEEKEK